eukprot:TRINITY_DN7517_c0_g1_i1.p1 TRINITY_DN7517_c0_g1~~TRINITY_DN7517_c0_g1_i1.p1  ORF type:complete len:283 (-),score=2.84 TRINITY_DN7517_c0_g1_i1:28-876(-)
MKVISPVALRKYRLAIAGALASVIALKIDNSLHESSIVVFWCLMRALRCISPSVPYGSVIVMCLSAAQILSAWIVAPHELSPTYLKFLNHHGGQSRELLNSLTSINCTPCTVLHPGISCTKHFPIFFVDGFLRALRVYTPLYLAFLLFSGNKSILNFVKNVVRSSAFLSAYCALSWLSACIFYNTTQQPVGRLQLLLHTWLGGLATLLERPSRRPELAVYCATYALESIYRHFRNRGIFPRLPWLGMITMICSFSIMLYHTDQMPVFVKNFLFRVKKDEDDA